MALFDALINDVANRFGLGASASPLVREVLGMVIGSPGGIGGFLDKLKAAGLGSEVASWLGRTDAAPLSAQQLDSALGSAALTRVANTLGLGTSAVSAAVAYTLPKVIGWLTPGGTIPTQLPSQVASFLSATTTPHAMESWTQRSAPATRVIDQASPRHIEVVHDEPQMARWLWPALGALAILGLGSFLFSNAARAPAPPVVAQTAVPTPPPSTPAAPARLALTNDNGMIHYSGAVHDEETRTSVINSLKAVFGADKIQGDIGIDLNRGAAPWLVNFRTALANLKVPGVEAVFDGSTVNLGGTISDADRDRLSNSLKSALGGGLVLGMLTDKPKPR